MSTIRPPKLPRRQRRLGRYRPRLEGLEDRTVLSTFTVSRLADDPEAGSLRWAITQANASPDPDTIDFTVTGAVVLQSALPNLSSEIDIAGPGADYLNVYRDAGAPAFRIFTVTGGPTVRIAGLTLQNGQAVQGGGVLVGGGTVTLANTLLYANRATSGSFAGAGAGGGIYVGGGSVTITHSVLAGNRAVGGPGTPGLSPIFGAPGGPGGAGSGGGIQIAGGTVVVHNSTVVANEAVGGRGGPGGPGCTTEPGCGPGYRLGGPGGNGGAGSGGGLQIAGGTLQILSSTFALNQANGGPGGPGGSSRYPFPPGRPGFAGSGLGGGLASFPGLLQTGNTILAGNTVVSGSASSLPRDLSGPLGSLGHNLVGVGDGGSGYQPTDLVGTTGAPLDARLEPLGDYGGPTPTMRPRADSPARDAGLHYNTVPTDQRGFPRPASDPADIGAVELQPGELSGTAARAGLPAASGEPAYADLLWALLTSDGRRSSPSVFPSEAF